MKVELKKTVKDVLQDGLAKASMFAKKNTQLPILKGILFRVSKTEITIIGSTRNEIYSYSIPVDENIIIHSEGELVLPINIEEIIKRLKKDIMLEQNESKMCISSGSSRFVLNCLNPDEYPFRNDLQNNNAQLNLNTRELSSDLAKVVFAASKSDARPILKGVALQAKDGYLTLQSTDSYRLGYCNKAISMDQEFKFIFPAEEISNAFKKLFNESNDIEIYLNSELNKVIFKNGFITYSVSMIVGEYPDLERLLPSDFSTEIKFNRKELIKAIELLKPIVMDAHEEKKGILRLKVANDQLELSSYQTQAGNGKVAVSFSELIGETNLELAVSMTYILDALKEGLEGEEIWFKSAGSNKPFILSSEEFEEHLQLVLPVRS
ncbi:DNA polymerase III subunit beta [Bacillus swezeyi]|nr:DNA polymerase III subunit beta [Bacillus swezeyi]